MTKISFYASIVLGFSTFLSSCQIEKQYHSGGFKLSGPQLGISNNQSRVGTKPQKFTKSGVNNGTRINNGTTSKPLGNPMEEQPPIPCFFQGYSTGNFQENSRNHPQLASNNKSHLPIQSSRYLGTKATSDFFTGQPSSLMVSPILPNYRKQQSNVFPPDTVIIYDTVFEEEILIIPDSTKALHDAMMLKSQELKEKSLLPMIGGYVMLMLGSIGIIISAMVAVFSFGNATIAALLILGASLLVILFGGLTISKGMKMESESRILAKKAKALLQPYEAPKPKKSTIKKSNKKLLFGILIGYLILQFGAAIISAL